MQISLAPIIAGCIAIAALGFATPRAASATTAVVPAVQYGETNAGIVQQVGYRYYRGGHRNYGYRNYGYRRYGYGGYGYRRYGYGGYGYRPYGYYGGYGYPYWRRPGISLWFGF